MPIDRIRFITTFSGLVTGLTIGSVALCRLIIPLGDTPRILYIPLLFIAFYILYLARGTHNKQSLRFPKISLLMAITGFVYLMAELAINISAFSEGEEAAIPAINSGFGVFNGPCADFDTIRGYRWRPGQHRMTKILNNKVIYDQCFTVNQQGFYSRITYAPKKNLPARKRLIVLGDSFTSGEYLEMPLTDKLNALQSPDTNAIEFLSFSVNGGGLRNWHNLFFKEVVPEYEFDGVILNVFGNDLSRGFFTMHHLPDVGHTGYFDSIPHSLSDYLQNYLPHTQPYAPYLNDSAINNQIAALAIQNHSKLFVPDLYLLKALILLPLIIQQQLKISEFNKAHFSNSDKKLSMEEVTQNLGKSRIKMLEDILNYCTAHGKQLTIVSIPYNQAFAQLKKGKTCNETVELQTIADHYHIIYFDGMESYASYSQQGFDSCFFPNDIHWNQKGSDIFANSFLKFYRNLPDIK